MYEKANPGAKKVSTRSRPKAAGKAKTPAFRNLTRFNTQPPEGGWLNHTKQA